ncbi:MMPL family transporter [Streptomyces fuscigenes]|uniref:MMPL family transporter n=1 Tax=Streptomyces fuscigenes TaxID=1528880 RepID=UPI001F2087E6|nr:MMPL family transporter [Streptomyces fuscigenes]MCF3961428.1 MMPL family transporter [Streptomyces fuscigenes]
MFKMTRWCFEHRRSVLAFWLVAVVATVALSQVYGSRYDESVSLPGTDSQAAVDLLTHNFPSASGEADQVVIEAVGGADIRSPSVRQPVTAALDKVAAVPGVESVSSPYGARGAGQVSKDGTIAFATVTWDKVAADVTKDDASRLIDAAKSADGPNVKISLGGRSIANEESAGPGVSVGVGFVAALVVLLIVFGGAVFASLLPLLTAVVALAIGTSLITLLSHVLETPSVSRDLAVLIGLGVGVDYGLFITSRHRAAVRAGRDFGDAAQEAVNTSGRTVLFAGITVCIALLGQFALGVDFLYGVSAASALTVALTMATALTLLPAVLGFLGPKILSRRERRALAAAGPRPERAGGSWLRWASFVEARSPYVAVAALAVVVVIALPTFSLRLGSSGANTDPPSSTTHQAYTALAKGFGPGFNGPFQLVSKVTSPAQHAAFVQFLRTAAHTPGVARVTPPLTSPNREVSLAVLYPDTGPGAQATVSLVSTLRDDLIPAAESGSGLDIHVGGATPANIDFSHVLSGKLPLFVAVVVVLAFLLLVAVFHSILVPLVAAVMNLLSVGAALGALNAVFTWGWAQDVLNINGTGPVDAFIPVVLFSVLFGLSMDYEVYLVGRIQEEWNARRRERTASAGNGEGRGTPAEEAGTRRAHGAHRASGTPAEEPMLPRGSGRRRNHAAVTIGQAKSGRIIAAAAGIMILVFGSFLINDQRVLQEFGFGLAFAVLVDALIIRGLLVPALMHLIGPLNWAMPGWLRRVVPDFSIEADSGAKHH